MLEGNFFSHRRHRVGEFENEMKWKSTLNISKETWDDHESFSESWKFFFLNMIKSFISQSDYGISLWNAGEGIQRSSNKKKSGEIF